MANNVTNQYGFDLSLGSDYWNQSSNNSNTWNTDWDNVGDYSWMSGSNNNSQDNDNSGINWKKAIEAVDKSMARKKYQEEGKEQTVKFGKPFGSSGFQLGQDSYVYTPQQQAPFTIAGQQSSGGGLGSTIGNLIGIGGTALGVFGPLGPAAGAVAGKAVDQIFG